MTIPDIIFVQSWGWAYGQTPEFTYSIENSFKWGNIVCVSLVLIISSAKALSQTAEINSKHGVILSCTFSHGTREGSRDLSRLSQALEGQRYGFVDRAAVESKIDEAEKEVWDWLRIMMAR